MINNKKAAPKSRFAPPIWVWVAYALALISATVTLIATASPDFAAFFNRYISGPIRWLLAKITCVIPFSLAEFLIITIPISLALIIISAIRKTEKSLKAIALYFIKLFAVCAFVFSLFVFTFGVGYLKARLPELKIVAVEPKDSPLLSGGKAAPHKLQGIGANFIPSILSPVYDEVFPVASSDAYGAVRALGKAEGIAVGISSGAALFAAIELARREENRGRRIVVLLPDGIDRYLSTDIFD